MAAAAVPLLAIGTAVSAFGAIQQARAASDVGDYNAAINERNAGLAREQALADSVTQQRMASRVIGRATAAYGASGITQEGSPLDVLEFSTAEAERDRQNILKAGELKAIGYTDTARLDRMRGSAGARAGMFRAGSELLLGAGKIYGSLPESPQTGYRIDE